MGAYNRVNGEPCCSSEYLLNEILRKQWKFKGHVVSDWGAIKDIFRDHKVVGTGAEAAAMAINAGCDLFCSVGIFTKKRKRIRWDWIRNAVETGLLSEKVIDKALYRLFKARFLLGMFDPPEIVPYTDIPYEINDCEEHRNLALEAAKKSIVLLKNEGDLLPLNKNLKKIAVIGPTADNKDVLLGNYNGEPSRYTTILDGIKEYTSDQIDIAFSEGCPLREKSTEGFNDAVDKARDADFVILVLGISPRLEGEEGQATESDLGGDRLDIKLPGSQEDLLKTIYDQNKPIVLILTGGSALSFNFAKEKIPSIIYAWYPGEEGGKAVAEVIFGDYNPAGRLPVTFYKSVDDLPEIRDYSMVGRTYRYFEGEPLYPFGYGLSYTKFKYSSLRISSEAVKGGESVKLSVNVENIGKREGEEVVQLYLSQSSQSFRLPIRELRGFKRIFLDVNKKKTVSFEINQKDYSIVNMEGERIIQSGKVTLFVGGSQPGFAENPSEGLIGSFTII